MAATLKREQVTIGVTESIESQYLNQYMQYHFELNERKRCDAEKKLQLKQDIEQRRLVLVEGQRQLCESANKIETLISDMAKQNVVLEELDVKYVNASNEQKAKEKELKNLENDLANVNKSKHQLLAISNDLKFNNLHRKRSRKVFATVNIVSVIVGVKEFQFQIIFWIFAG